MALFRQDLVKILQSKIQHKESNRKEAIRWRCKEGKNCPKWILGKSDVEEGFGGKDGIMPLFGSSRNNEGKECRVI